MAYEKSKDSLIDEIIDEINKRVEEKILEKTNADLLIKLINNADTLAEAINIEALWTTNKKTGFHFDKRLEKLEDNIYYFKRNEKFSFVDSTHNTTQHNTTQHNTTQHNTTQHNTTQHNTTQHNTTQRVRP